MPLGFKGSRASLGIVGFDCQIFCWLEVGSEASAEGGRKGCVSLLTYVVRPFELHGYIRVAGVICSNTFDNCEGGDVLKKDDGGLIE